MTIQEKINAEMASAITSRDTKLLDFLKVVVSEFSREASKTLTDEEVIKVLTKLKKYASTNNNQFEIDYLDKYIPSKLSEEKTKEIVKETISLYGFSTIGQMGQVMGKLKRLPEADKMDMKIANKYVRELLMR